MKTLTNIILTIALTIAFCGSARASLPPEARQALHKAQLLMDEKKFDEAATLLKMYADKTETPVPEQVYLVRGGALYQAGKVKKALNVFKQGHAAHPKNEHLCRNTGVILYELQRFGEAGKFLEKAYGLQKQPTPQTLYQAGSAYYLGGKYSESAGVLSRLISTSPTPRKEWIRLAVHALLDGGQPERAEKMLLKLLNNNQSEADYWKLLAKLHLDRERYSEAAAALEVCHRLVKPSKQDFERLASLYNYLEAPLMAADNLRQAYGTSPSAEQALKIATLYGSAGRLDQAVSFLEKHSNKIMPTLRKGEMLYKARKFKEAEDVFNKTLQEQSTPEARFFLGLCAWERRDWKTAEKQFSKVSGKGQYKQRASGSLTVIRELETARIEAEG
ncbi:hypothetical protein D0S45_10120 [Marinifilum sp. JC120]|nr:hypothetical protein D0S45_10120 [Marinifilum sp. JC120]